MSKKIKIFIVRKDGIVQRYTIKRSNLKKYVKVSERKKERRKVWIPKERKIRLERKKRIKAPKKPKEKKIPEKKKMIKQVWNIKYIYKSPKASYHNLITEIEATTIREKPLSEQEMKEMAKTCANFMLAVEEEGLPFIYTTIEVGLVNEEEVEEQYESTEAELITYKHELD